MTSHGQHSEGKKACKKCQIAQSWGVMAQLQMCVRILKGWIDAP